jgi:excisionase family DNA binding protein
MTNRQIRQPVERLLTVGQVAELLGTTERFPRRLIAERRIRFVRVGRHVRIPETALVEFIESGLVEPVPASTHRRAGLWATRQAAAVGSALSVSCGLVSGRRGTEALTGSCAPLATRSRPRRTPKSG